MRRVAVSGASGFIGRHVVGELNGRDDVEVVCVARRKRPDLPSPRNGRWVFLDIHEQKDHLFDMLGQPQALIHLAWGGLPNYQSLHHFETELPRHFAFLKQLVQEGLSSLVAVGTCLEYGMQCGRLREDSDTRPNNPYAFAKDALRRELEFLKLSTEFNLIWPRLFYIYGEGQASSSLLPQLRCAVESGKLSFDMSPGDQLRDYLPVTEVAKQLVFLALEGEDIGPINVCSGVPISVRDIVEEWIRVNDWHIQTNLRQFPYPNYEPLAFWGDNSKFRGLLKP